MEEYWGENAEEVRGKLLKFLDPLGCSVSVEFSRDRYRVVVWGSLQGTVYITHDYYDRLWEGGECEEEAKEFIFQRLKEGGTR